MAYNVNSNYNRDQREPSPTRVLWRHVFFIERVIQTMALKQYKSPEQFREDFGKVATAGDWEMLNNNMKSLSDPNASGSGYNRNSDDDRLPFR